MDIGIDLGTTFSVVAVNGRVELASDYPGGPGVHLKECDVTVIPTPYGEPTFPSVIMQDPENPERYLFGADALQRAEEGIPPVMFSKRKIGTREAIPMQTKSVWAKDVAREFLRYMKSCAEQALAGPVARAVVTHPAYFDRGAVEETREAAIEAGFDMALPEQMLMEPVAAALSYSRTDRRDPLRVLTYDMGGGTFDVTCLERREGVLDMRAFDGDHLLGGYNFDRELAHWIRQRLQEHGRRINLDESRADDRGRLMRLLRLAERVKIDLANSPADSAMVEIRARDILVDVDGKPVQINERISREQFVALIQPHLDKAVACCRRALAKAKVGPDEIHEILLVGGSTYGPWIARSLVDAFPPVQPKLFSPDLCVGAGAAIHAQLVLPALVKGECYTLTLDAPTTCVLDRINIAGQVAGESAVSLRAILILPDGRAVEPSTLDTKGMFLFENVELEVDLNRFRLHIMNSDGIRVLEHNFSVAYSPADTDTSAVVTVLPRPLYIETVDGLAPIAEEGVPLPARCSRTFRRVNDNPNITLRLFQEEEPIGEVRIENIPPEGGRGSEVHLELEVTEKNQIRGTAVVRTTAGKTVVETAVQVRFNRPEIAPGNDLRREFDGLRRALMARLLSADDRAQEIEREGLELVNIIERLFEQQPLERQEVQVELRHLGKLLTPPEDTMKPPRDVFAAAVKRCRTALEEKVRAANETMQGEATGHAGAPDDKLITTAREAQAKATQHCKTLDKLEVEGLDAHDRKDRQAWARIYDALVHLEAQFRERRDAGEMPTAIHKFLAGHELFQYFQILEDKVEDLSQRGNLEDWRNEIERIKESLAAALKAIHNVRDDLPSGQGLAQVQQVFARVSGPVQQAIRNLGADIKVT
jgi:molecular chaperone DnaK (HSP70)